MSLTPKNLRIDGLDVISDLILLGVPADDTGFDGSPIYTQLDASVTIDGSYSLGAVDYSYSSAVLTMPTLTRIGLRDALMTPFAIETRYPVPGRFRTHTADIGGTSGVIPSGRFVAGHVRQVSVHNPVPFEPPAFYGDTSIVVDPAGTKTDNGTTPATVTDLAASAIWSVGFTGAIETGDLVFKVYMSVTVNLGDGDEYTVDLSDDIDASAWGMADFRDIRGTYSPSGTDGNGITYTGSLTIS